MEKLGADCLFHILSRVRTMRCLRSMLCTCTFALRVWETYGSHVKWDPWGKELAVIVERSLYYNVKLSEDQKRAISHILGRASALPTDALGIHLQLPMSSGKTVIGLSVCLERVKRLGGLGIYALPVKVMESTLVEVDKMFGTNMRRDKDCIEVDGVTIYFLGSSPCAFYGTGADMIICDRSAAAVFLTKREEVNTVVCDESHTGSVSLERIVRECERRAERPLLVTMTAANMSVDEKGMISLKGSKMEYYGRSDASGMDLPPVMYLVASTTKNTFYVRPRDETVVGVRERMLKAFDDEMRDCLRREDNLLTREKLSASAELMAYLVECLEMLEGKVFIITSFAGVNVVNLDSKKVVNLATGAKIITKVSEIRDCDRIVVGAASSFSEGVNITDFSNVVLLNTGDDPETIVQCVGRFQRITNEAPMISVCVITDSPNVALASMVPRRLTSSYLRARGLKKLYVSTLDGDLVSPDITFGEIVALCYKTNKRAVTEKWVSENGLVNFSIDGGSFRRIKGYRWRNVPARGIRDAFKFYVDQDAADASCSPMMDAEVPSFRESVIVPERKAPDLADFGKSVEEIIKRLEYLAYYNSCGGRGYPQGMYKVDDLKAMCVMLGTSKAGKKGEITERLLRHLKGL